MPERKEERDPQLKFIHPPFFPGVGDSVEPPPYYQQQRSVMRRQLAREELEKIIKKEKPQWFRRFAKFITQTIPRRLRK